MKRIFSFLMITIFMFMVIEIFTTNDLTVTSREMTYTFTPDAEASLSQINQPETENKPSKMDSVTLLLLGSGMIGLAGFGRERKK